MRNYMYHTARLLWSSLLIVLIISSIFSNSDSHVFSRKNYIEGIGGEDNLVDSLFSDSNLDFFLIENRGQIENSRIRYYNPSKNIWFTDTGVWFRQIDMNNHIDYIITQQFKEPNHINVKGICDTNNNISIISDNNTNYIPNNYAYKDIKYMNIWDGIDLRYFFHNGKVKRRERGN